VQDSFIPLMEGVQDSDDHEGNLCGEEHQDDHDQHEGGAPD
jgi:hypothetical protein